MAKSHQSDNPSADKPLHRFFGNENANAKDMRMPAGGMTGKGKLAVSKHVATRQKEGSKRRG